MHISDIVDYPASTTPNIDQPSLTIDPHEGLFNFIFSILFYLVYQSLFASF